MRQIALALLACAALAATAAAAPQDGAEFAAPCNDDGLAHIPDRADGQPRPYSVRKRSRTVHRDQTSVTDDTPQLPPGQRRFDAVLPDEQGHDAAASTTARGARHRGQRRLSEDAANDVAAGPQASPQQRRLVRRPVRPKKVAELNVPEEEHDAKTDAVVDSYEAVRRYPTHLPDEEDLLDDDGNLASNDIAGAPTPLNDQVAQEDVPTASTEQRVDGDLPPGYRSKFPQRTFASDAGGSGDVLRVKPRKHANQYQPPPQHDEHVDVEDAAPATPPPQRRRPAPRPRPAAPRVEAAEEAPETPAEPVAASRGPQRYRASHRVRQGGEQPQRQQPLRRRPDAVPAQADAEVNAAPVPDARRPEPQLEQEHGPEQRPLRRRPRPRPAAATTPPPPADDLAADNAVPTTPITPAEEAQVLDVQPQTRPRPQRRRQRPRPVPAEEAEDGDNSVQRVQRRRRPQAPARTVSEQSFSVQSSQDTTQEAPHQPTRGQGRRLSVATPGQNLPQVEVAHDGTAQENTNDKNEGSLVRTAVKKVPAGGHGGDPSPALIQKIVKNALRRLQPQIAQHEGDVGVDILVKIIEVEDR